MFMPERRAHDQFECLNSASNFGLVEIERGVYFNHTKHGQITDHASVSRLCLHWIGRVDPLIRVLEKTTFQTISNPYQCYRIGLNLKDGKGFLPFYS